MYTNKDIRCFVMTRNRADLLVESINSLLSQQGGPWDIWVIDNSTDDKTEQLIKTKYPNIHYKHTNPLKQAANLLEMLSLMDTPYSLTLHDDDLLAPNYLENALKAINYYPNISGVFSKYYMFNDKEIPPNISCNILNTKHWLIPNQADFALSFWDDPSPCWTGSVLRSDLYKNIDIGKNSSLYGKICDWSILIESMKEGNTLIFQDTYIYYRIHAGQDSKDKTNGITAQQLANWLRFFKNFAISKRELKNIYIIRAYENALSNYNSFLSKKEQPICRDLPSWFIKENLNIPPMKIYHKILSNKILYPLKHIFKRIYKRNYFKKFLTDFK